MFDILHKWPNNGLLTDVHLSRHVSLVKSETTRDSTENCASLVAVQTDNNIITGKDYIHNTSLCKRTQWKKRWLIISGVILLHGYRLIVNGQRPQEPFAQHLFLNSLLGIVLVPTVLLSHSTGFFTCFEKKGLGERQRGHIFPAGASKFMSAFEERREQVGVRAASLFWLQCAYLLLCLLARQRLCTLTCVSYWVELLKTEVLSDWCKTRRRRSFWGQRVFRRRCRTSFIGNTRKTMGKVSGDQPCRAIKTSIDADSIEASEQ
jgi:hypothetical protein